MTTYTLAEELLVRYAGLPTAMRHLIIEAAKRLKALDDQVTKLAAERDAARAELREFAEDVAHQFGYHSQYNGRLTLTHGGLSTLESAFDILGWENPHPDPENECQYEGCHHYASCGTLTSGGYLRLCSRHCALILNGAESAFSIKSATDTNVTTKEEDQKND